MTLNNDKCKLGMCCYTKNVFSQSRLEISQILAILTSVKIGGGNKGGEGAVSSYLTLCARIPELFGHCLELDKCRCVPIPTATTPPGSKRFKFICASLQHTCRQPLQRSCLREVRKNKSKCMVEFCNGCLILNALVEWAGLDHH